MTRAPTPRVPGLRDPGRACAGLRSVVALATWLGHSRPVTRTELEEALRQSLEDHKLSRSERRALREVMRDAALDVAALDWLRHRAFALAADELAGPAKREVLGWLQDVVGLLTPPPAPALPRAEAHFSPGDSCVDRIARLLRAAGRSVDICVFTITDDRITREILAAHARSVRVRLVTDDDKASDRGSDVVRLSEAGIATAVDNSRDHMHHKFAIFDASTLVTGSYNWTRSASEGNCENIVVIGDRSLLGRFREEFDRLWLKYR